MSDATPAPVPAAPASDASPASPAAPAAAMDDMGTFAARVMLPDGCGELRLANVPLIETLVSLRSMLADHAQACMFTSYRLELDVPAAAAPIVLTELTDLTPYAERLLSPPDAPGALIRVVPENYDVRRARAHVRVLREVLAHPPVTSSLLAELEAVDASMPASGDAVAAPAAQAGVDAARDGAEDAEEPQPAEAALSRLLDEGTTGNLLFQTVSMQRMQSADAQRRIASVVVPAVPDLAAFYPLPLPTRMLEEVTTSKDSAAAASLNAGENSADNASLLAGVYARAPGTTPPRPVCVRSITYSGWNPPPAQRRLMGDLCYLVVETVEGRSLHITCSPTGFYLNKTTSESGFDPSPANPSYSSRTLFSLLSRASPSFKTQYHLLLAHACADMRDALHQVNNQWDAAFTLAVYQEGPAAAFPGVTIDDSGAAGAVGDASLRSGDVVPLGIASAQAATYGMAVPPAGPFLLCRAPWLIPPSTPAGANAASDTAAVASSSSSGRRKPAGTAASAALPSSSTAVATRSATSSIIPGHTFNPARAEDDMLCTFGMNERGALRDWNEEWQACKELPASTLQERIVRARASAKVLSDFVDAATQGCMAIVQGHITCLDPSDDPRTHVYVYNNIFFSMALDPKTKEVERRAKMMRASKATGPVVAPPGAFDDLASLASPNHDLQGVMALNKVDIKGLHTLATCIITYAGHRFVAQSIIPGILQAEPASRMVYGSVDNGATVASEPALHALLNTAAAELCIAERIVQPLGKQTPADAAPLSGGEASGATPAASLSVVPSVVPKSVLAHNSCAGESPVPFIGPVECKGIQGSDGRYYILDCVRLTPRDPVFYDAALEAFRARAGSESSHPADSDEYTGVYETAHTALLRPELLQWYAAYRRLSAVQAARDAAAASGSAKEITVPPLRLNVNVFTRFMKTVAAEERAADETAVRDVAAYLHDIVVPHIFSDWRLGANVPLEGEMLTRQLHHKGINVRYLGRLARMAVEAEARAPTPPYLLELFETEMVARVARRLMDSLLRDNAACKAAPAVAIAGFLNALLGEPPSDTALAEASYAATAAATAPLTASQKKKAKKAAKVVASTDGASDKDAELSSTTVGTGAASSAGTSAVQLAANGLGGSHVKFPAVDIPQAGDVCRKALFDADVVHSSLWTAIEEEVKSHFHYSLTVWARGGYNASGASALKAVTSTSSTSAPAAPGHGLSERAARMPLLRRICQRAGIQLVARRYDWASSAPFTPEDIAGMVPVIKSCMPSTLLPDASLLQQEARSLFEQQPQRAYDKIQEATTLMQHVLGALNKDLAYNCQFSAMILNLTGEKYVALQQQQRAVLLYERLLGADSPETAHAHTMLGSYLAAVGATNAAVRHMYRGIYLTSLMAPASHPEVSNLYARLAIVYQNAQHISMTLRCLFEALRNRYDPITQMHYAHALALAFALAGDFRNALRWEHKVQEYYRSAAGEDSDDFNEAAMFVKLFTTKAVDLERVERVVKAAMSESNGELAAALGWPSSGEDAPGVKRGAPQGAPGATSSKGKSSKSGGKVSK